MQLSYSSPDTNTCAIHLDDKRLNKIIIEAAQILSTALWLKDCNTAETLYAEGKIYLPSHENHPLVKHCASNYTNYHHTCKYLHSLLNEYYFRFGKFPKTIEKYDHLLNQCFLFKEPVQKYVPYNATTHNKHIEDVYKAYKQELVYKWQRDKKPPEWTGRKVPEFYREFLNGKYDYWKWN